MTFIDVWIKLPSGPQLPDAALSRIPSQARAALKSRGLGFMLTEDEGGEERIVTASHDVAIYQTDNVVITRGTYDEDGNELAPTVFGGPHLMVRFVSEKAKDAWLAARGNLGGGMRIVPDPGTHRWA